MCRLTFCLKASDMLALAMVVGTSTLFFILS
jgi:hypothetical protein